jgi:hypothetical protein
MKAIPNSKPENAIIKAKGKKNTQLQSGIFLSKTRT